MATPDEATKLDVGALFRAHGAVVFRVVERMTGPGPHVDDLVQQAFLTALERKDQLPSEDQQRAWLIRTALNHVRHHRRSFVRRTQLAQHVQTHDEPNPPPMPEAVVERRRQAQWIRECTLAIPEKQRAVFILHELEEWEVPAIANLLDIPENTVWSRLRTARAVFERHAMQTRKKGVDA